MRQKKSFVESRRKMREAIDMVMEPEPMEVTRPTQKKPAPKAEGFDWGLFAGLTVGTLCFPFLAAAL